MEYDLIISTFNYSLSHMLIFDVVIIKCRYYNKYNTVKSRFNKKKKKRTKGTKIYKILNIKFCLKNNKDLKFGFI